MGKKKSRGYPTDSEAGARAKTNVTAHNVEEAAHAVVEQTIPLQSCARCAPLPALFDPRGTHKCARCRREKA